LLFWLIPLLVLTTIGWRFWTQRRQEFPLIAERGRTQGIPALDEGEFDKAFQILTAARSAVDALGDAVEGAEEIRQAAAEAALFVDPASASLEDMLEEAARRPSEWETRFSALYKGRAVFIDSTIKTAKGQEGASAYQLWYIVFPRGETTSFRDQHSAEPDRYAELDLTDFELFELHRPNLNERVIFGARVASLTLESGKKWVVRLEPRSGVYITHTRALQVFGWPDAQGIDESQTQEGRP
jgi:hypothetical protein